MYEVQGCINLFIFSPRNISLQRLNHVKITVIGRSVLEQANYLLLSFRGSKSSESLVQIRNEMNDVGPQGINDRVKLK